MPAPHIVQGSAGVHQYSFLHLLALLDHPTKGKILLKNKNTKNFTGEEKNQALLEGYQPNRGDDVVLVGARAKDQFGKIVLEGRVTKTFSTRLRPAVD